jgi:hypothetical protein
MILVAGLVIAALAIAAAFYYSVRAGRSRARAGARPARSGAEQFAGGRDRNSPSSSSRAVRSAGSAGAADSAGSRPAGGAGPGPRPGSAWAGPMTGPGEEPAPLVAGPRTDPEAFTGPRRRVAWRKGTDVDRELWPIETFGGVSDEQFWDDLAADRPLASMARTAQADSGPSPQPARSTQPPRAHPATRPAAADRTAMQTAVPAEVQPARAAATPSPMTARAYPARTQPPTTATQPVRAARQPTESHGRRSSAVGGPGTDEDPLTSPAYSLRAKGAVDGHSYQSSDRYRADPLGQDGYSPGSSASAGTTGAPAYQPGQGPAGRYGGTAAYPDQGQPRSQSAQASQSASTPPYGDRYGYRNPVSPADLTSATGHRGQGSPGGNGIGEGQWDPRRAYPPVNGYRSPYDPPGKRLPLTSLGRPRAH